MAARSYLRCKTKSWFKIFPRVRKLNKVRAWYKLAWFIHCSFFIARRPRDDVSLNLKSAIFWKPQIPWKVPDALKLLCQGRYTTLIELYLISYDNKKGYQNILTYDCFSCLINPLFFGAMGKGVIYWKCKYFTERRALELSLLSKGGNVHILQIPRRHKREKNDAEQS